MTASSHRSLLLALTGSFVVTTAGIALYRQPLATLRRLARGILLISGAHQQRVDLDGLPLRYFEAGTPGKGTIVLVSGLGAAPEDWLWLILALSRRWHVLAPDLPGFGATPMPPEGMGFSVLHGYFARFLDAVKVEHAALVGNSLGGAVVARYAAHHPDRVSRLFLLAGAGVHGGIPTVLERTPDQMRRDAAKGSRQSQPRFLLEDAIRRSRDPARLASLSSPDATDITGDLASIVVPTTIIWGDRDEVLPLRDGERLHRGIRGSELIVLRGVGHAPQVGAPRRVLEIMRVRLE